MGLEPTTRWAGDRPSGHTTNQLSRPADESKPGRPLDAPSRHSAPSTRRGSTHFTSARIGMETTPCVRTCTSGRITRRQEQDGESCGGRTACVSPVSHPLLYPFRSPFSFFAPTRRVCRHGERQREKERGAGRARQPPQTSILAPPCSQGQGCHRREPTSSGSLCTTKPCGKLRARKSRGEGKGT